jgi:hypothetical protein
MRIDEVPHGQIDKLRLRAVTGSPVPGSFVATAEAQLHYSESHALPLLTVGADVLPVVGDGRKHAVLLEDLCTRHLPRLVWIVDVTPPALVVQVHTFLHTLALPPVDIGVDERALESLTRIDRRLQSIHRALDWLRDQFLVASGGATNGTVRAFATANSDQSAGAFALHGRTTRAFIRRSRRAGEPEVLLLDKVVRGRAQSATPLALITGAVRFVDATVVSKLRADAAGELSSLVASGASFLNVWSRYGAIENEAALRRARRAGWLVYDHVESLPDDRFRFFLAAATSPENADAFKKALSGEAGLSIEAGESVPDVLTKEMTWAEYEALPRAETTATAIFGEKVELNRREHTVILTQRGNEEVAPPSRGVLYVSLHGDRTRLKRREEAWRAIREARCPMPQLGLLLEGRPVPTPRRGSISALTPSVKRKVFGKYSPTPTQEKALRVALNTPDIALIQGPPGTGKTTIIAALVERLQELWDASDGVQGRILISGFQHDAVENAIQRMSANGLPPIKFGGRQNRQEDADRVDAMIDAWRTERAAAIRARFPAMTTPAEDELSAEIEAYLLAPGTLEQTAAMLSRVADRLRRDLPAELTDRMHALSRELESRARVARQGDPDRDRAVRLVRAIRTTERAFLDDGARNAFRLARELERRGPIEPDVRELLAKAESWTQATVPRFLPALRDLQRRLLLRLLPVDRTKDTVPRVRTDVLALLTEARDHLERRHRCSRSAADEAILSFLSALEQDPDAVKQAVISYTSVFAATCQQCQPMSRHGDLAELKGIDGAYDTVVVDEAARATPLDLFIPMAKASRRIVLVGDHRQLPHILDRELERELEEALSSESTAIQRTKEMLNESLFKRLFDDLREREARDGIPRTVTLDEQYRMHPLLGDFVSAQFYPASEAFRSPRPASEFSHSLPGHSGPATWLRVPRRSDQEAEIAVGHSKARPVEAAAIVAELKRLMDCDAGRNLTFGVISFYSAQVDVLAEELERAGMAYRTEDDAVEIAEPYRETRLENGRVAERLRFGTVDAFQGMEFDVVFLSMVRSNAFREDSERERRRKYGHLMSPNRLCVAMSRQKRLLVVAGDDDMVKGAGAAAAIGPLVKFYELCEVRDAARV